jgi:hypothetical protein
MIPIFFPSYFYCINVFYFGHFNVGLCLFWFRAERIKREVRCKTGAIPVAVSANTTPATLQTTVPIDRDGKVCRDARARRPARIIIFPS